MLDVEGTRIPGPGPCWAWRLLSFMALIEGLAGTRSQSTRKRGEGLYTPQSSMWPCHIVYTLASKYM